MSSAISLSFAIHRPLSISSSAAPLFVIRRLDRRIQRKGARTPSAGDEGLAHGRRGERPALGIVFTCQMDSPCLSVNDEEEAWPSVRPIRGPAIDTCAS